MKSFNLLPSLLWQTILHLGAVIVGAFIFAVLNNDFEELKELFPIWLIVSLIIIVIASLKKPAEKEVNYRGRLYLIEATLCALFWFIGYSGVALWIITCEVYTILAYMTYGGFLLLWYGVQLIMWEKIHETLATVTLLFITYVLSGWGVFDPILSSIGGMADAYMSSLNMEGESFLGFLVSLPFMIVVLPVAVKQAFGIPPFIMPLFWPVMIIIGILLIGVAVFPFAAVWRLSFRFYERLGGRLHNIYYTFLVPMVRQCRILYRGRSICPMQKCEMEIDEDEKLYCLHCNLRAIKEGKAWQNSSENTLTAQTEKIAYQVIRATA